MSWDSDARREFEQAVDLLNLHNRTGDLSALHKSVASYRRALDVIPTDSPKRSEVLSNLGAVLGILFARTGELDALLEAVQVGRVAVALTPADHPDRAECLGNLGVALATLFQRTGDLDALHEAVASFRETVAAVPTDHPDRVKHLVNLSAALNSLSGTTEDLDTLREAVQLGREARAASTTTHPDRDAPLNGLGTTLLSLYRRTGDLDALHEAVASFREAVAVLPTDHPRRTAFLSHLGIVLRELSARVGDLDLLAEAVQIARVTVTATPAGDPDRPMHLTNLGSALQTLHERTGDPDALHEAIESFREAVAVLPTDHPRRSLCLNNLGVVLLNLFEQTGELAVLIEAVQIGREAVALTTADDPSRARRLSGLGSALGTLFERTRTVEVLHEAISLFRDALAAVPVDGPDRVLRLANLGAALLALHGQTQDLDTLNEAARSLREAAAVAPPDHPDRARHSGSLSTILRTLYGRTKELDLIVEAVQVARQSVDATPVDHPERARRLGNVGAALTILFEETEDPAALASAREAFADAAASPAASIADRVGAGRELGRRAMRAGEPEAALAAFENVVELIPQIAPRTLARSDREHGLGSITGLAAEVAAAAVDAGRPERAVELLEQTRGVLLGELIDARGDLTDLRRAAPGLATEFNKLRARVAAMEENSAVPSDFLAEPRTAPGDATRRGEQRKQLATDWTALLERIRAMPGWERFLRPVPVDQLRKQADSGPIIMVYASPSRSDALILTSDASGPVQVVPLPELTAATALEQTNRLMAARTATDSSDITARASAQSDVQQVLGWMWDTITGPILERLELTGRGGRPPRVWWCPVGFLAYLPLHAAGHHTDRGAAEPPRTVLDRVVSSYTITLRALARARTRPGAAQAPAGSNMIIAMPSTPGQPDLPGAREEANVVASLLGPRLVLTGPEATHRTVAAELAQHRIAHFACYGLSNRANPAGSRLLLADHEDDPLTVSALMRLHLTEADLAFLSACSTTDTSPQLVDEAVHLTAAIHLAGYRHVIGTLWQINDSSQVATDVYTYLTRRGTQQADTEDSAFALAEATRNLRDRYPSLPLRWAAHLHLGP